MKQSMFSLSEENQRLREENAELKAKLAALLNPAKKKAPAKKAPAKKK